MFLSDNVKRNRLMVDCRATSHLITEMNNFTRFDETLNPESHYMELADGTRTNNVVLKQGDAEVLLQDSEGKSIKITLKRPSLNRHFHRSSPYNLP